MDISNPEKHLSKFVLKARAEHDRFDGLGGIEQLPVNFREVILLCDVEDASYREIAEILSIPIGTVMSRLARARKIVRESLRNPPGEPVSAEAAQGAVAINRDVHRPGANDSSCWNKTPSGQLSTMSAGQQ
jgi:hypothetical protein